mgnify:CR=1 FL=1
MLRISGSPFVPSKVTAFITFSPINRALSRRMSDGSKSVSADINSAILFDANFAAVATVPFAVHCDKACRFAARTAKSVWPISVAVIG